MDGKQYLTENEVIDGVASFLLEKGKTSRRSFRNANAAKKEHGIDLQVKLANEKGNGNFYFIEAKGNLKSDGSMMKSNFLTDFRFAVSQIILRIKLPSNRNNRIYGIAIPDSEYNRCLALIKDNWALAELKIRIYGAYRNADGKLTAHEYLPRDIYSI